MTKTPEVAEGAKNYILNAVRMDYTVNYKVENGYYWHESFVKGVRHVWQIREGWQTADLLQNEPCLRLTGQYRNHKTFDNLLDALCRPLTKL